MAMCSGLYPGWASSRRSSSAALVLTIYQMALMGASAAGAAVWGQWASHDSVEHSLTVAAASGAVAMFIVLRVVRDRDQVDDLTPAEPSGTPVAVIMQAQGRIVISIFYRIDPARAKSFIALMQESRRSRLALGALGWELLQDLNEPGLSIEQIIDESWTQHLRRFHR